jgi:DNA modification methylase
MTKVGYGPLASADGLIEHLKMKGRDRRKGLERMSQTSAAPRVARNDLLPTLSLVELPLETLRVFSRKLRKLDPAHIREVAATISELGFCDPILVGRSNMVIDGEIRVEAAKLLGLSNAPCILIEHLSAEQQRLLRLAVNRLGEKGQWSLDALKIEFEELILVDAPIEISGFSLDEIDQIIIGDKLESVEQGPLEPGGQGAAAIARIGDVFQLGPHRVVCGDATDPAVYLPLFDDGAAARLILTDVPYNVKIAGHVTGGAHREFVKASGEMTDDEYLKFNVDEIDAATRHLVDGGVYGTFIDWRGLPIVEEAARAVGLQPLNLIVWSKTNAGMGSLYRSQHELLPLYKKGSATHVNNIELGKRGRWRSNVWTYPGASSLGSDARRGLKDHPTVKPTAMLADALLDLTHRGEIVLDPFLGSGSMLIAAHKTGRVCRGLELDPLYVDVIVRRYEAHSGEAAVLVETGETFEALAMRRASACGAPVGATGDTDRDDEVAAE